MRTLLIGLAAAICGTGGFASAATDSPGARLSEAFGSEASPVRSAWTLRQGEGPGDPKAGQWSISDGRITVQPGAAAAEGREGDFAFARYEIPAGASGFYTVENSFLRRDTGNPGRIDLRVFVRRAGVAGTAQPPPAVAARLEAGEVFDFDSFLGYLDAGDSVWVGIGPAGDVAGDRTEIDFTLVRAPAIPVSVMTEDVGRAAAIEAPGGWSVAKGVAADSSSARRRAWARGGEAGYTVDGGAAHVALQRGGGDVIAAFRVPHSGYYAVDDAWFTPAGGAVEARLYVGNEAAPRRTLRANRTAVRTGFNTDVGYVERGDTVYLAWTAVEDIATSVACTATIIEWAPRRAPLRVRRGDDGLLDVFEPQAPRRAIDVPRERWVTVPAMGGDATEAIRAALARAQSAQHERDYTGVRLEAGATYFVATDHVAMLFAVRGAQRLIFDGNGATLRVRSPELMRKRVGLFAAVGSRSIVFADFTVEADSVPFTIGDVLDVSPLGASQQTVTFRIAPGTVDPLREISRNGQADGFAYDARIPGRLAEGAWTHYPGDGTPSLRAGSEPGVFTHHVRRTGDSIRPGQKWLIKNKVAGVVYLTTSDGAEDVTLSGVVGRAAGGSHLLFWQTSGVNLLDCRFEPDGGAWIGSSSDSVHGRGREGVWIENTLFRGTCEDIMNTYGENMVVEADADATDAIMSIRMFRRTVESRSGRAMRLPTAENLAVGDQLVFFNPRSGRVLGYAGVKAVDGGRYTLSNRIEGVDTWEEGDGHGATMVYNTRAAGRFFVRDSRLMDSMRFGVYAKARGGVIFHTHFEGLSAAGVFAVNEPEWPEGPPATHLWVQGCLFSQNNHGYMSKHRAFMTVDPADISIYTRRLGDPAEPAAGFRAHVTSRQYANSHLKLIGNVFHDWRGMGIAVRNARNVRIDENLFLAPVEDPVLRRTLAADPSLAHEGTGRYAAVFLDSVQGVRLSGNRFHALPAGDLGVVQGADVEGVFENDNTDSVASGGNDREFEVLLPFAEWFGTTSAGWSRGRRRVDEVALNGATRGVGRLGAGLFFDGTKGPALLRAAPHAEAKPVERFTLALWVLPARDGPTIEVIYSQGNALTGGVLLAVENGRFLAGVWPGGGAGDWLDLGPATVAVWQHLAVVFDGPARTWRGFIDGGEVAASSANVPEAVEIASEVMAFGGIQGRVRLGPDRLAAGSAAFAGGVDEVRSVHRALDRAEVAVLALRRPD